MVWASVACSVCVCVCMCSYVSSWQDVGPRSLAVPLAAHGEALLICWSNRCQNTPGAVTLEGQEERRQCVLYTVVHRMSAAWHLLITAATFMWGNQDLPQSWFIRQTRVEQSFCVYLCVSWWGRIWWYIGCVHTGQTLMCYTEITPQKTHWETGVPQDWGFWSNRYWWQFGRDEKSS